MTEERITSPPSRLLAFQIIVLFGLVPEVYTHETNESSTGVVGVDWAMIFKTSTVVVPIKCGSCCTATSMLFAFDTSEIFSPALMRLKSSVVPDKEE